MWQIVLFLRCLVRCHRTFYVTYFYLFLCTNLSHSLSHVPNSVRYSLDYLAMQGCVLLSELARHTIISWLCTCITLRLCHTQLQEGEDKEHKNQFLLLLFACVCVNCTGCDTCVYFGFTIDHSRHQLCVI